MSEAMDVINAFGTPLKLAWVGWVAWGVGQYFWYRHERSMPVRRVTSVAKSAAAKKTAAPKTVAAQAAEAPVVGRLFTPTHVTAETKANAPVVAQAEKLGIKALGLAGRGLSRIAEFLETRRLERENDKRKNASDT